MLRKEWYQRARPQKAADDIVEKFTIFISVVIERVEEIDCEKNNTKTLLKLIEFSCGYIGRYNKLINARRNL